MKNMTGRIKTAVLLTAFGAVFALTAVFQPASESVFSITLFCAGMLVCIFLLMLNELLAQAAKRSERTLKISDKTFWLINAGSILIVGLIFLLIYYPATASNDTVYMIQNPMGYVSQHPWLYLLFIYCLKAVTFKIGGGYTQLLVLLVALQILLISVAYAYSVTWLKKQDLAAVPLVLISVFYVFCPILDLYMISVMKDVPFSTGIMAMIPSLYDCVKTNGKSLRSFKRILPLYCCIILLFLRNNGIYIAIVLALVLLVSCKKYWKRIVPFFVFIVFFLGASRAVENHFRAEHQFRETVGIPLQQIAAVVRYNGEISEAQLQFVDEVIPIEAIEKNYDPYNADTLKYGKITVNNEFLNSHKKEFMQAWFQLLIPNFRTYVKAYLQTTYGFWSFSNSTYKMKYTYIGAFADKSVFQDWITSQHISEKSLLPEAVQAKAENILDKIAVFFGAGTMFWIYVCILYTLMKIKGNAMFLVGLPCGLCWITLMLATPVAFQWRYSLFLAMSLPMLYGAVMIPDR